MPQFTPHDRKTVKEDIESHEHVAVASAIGPGLTVVFNEKSKEIRSVNEITERHGWYVAQMDFEHPNDVIIIMPITEVKT